MCFLDQVQFSSVAESYPALSDPMGCSMPGLPVHHQLLEFLKFMSIELVMPFNHLILCLPFLLQSSIFPSIRIFSNESVLHIRWPKYESFSFNISPSNEHSVHPMNNSTTFPLGWAGWISLRPGHSQEFSLTPQFKSINFSALSFLHSPTLTPIHDYWKNHSLD